MRLPERRGPAGGRPVERPRWPEGARCAVMLSFDVDGPALWIEEDERAWQRPGVFSLGAYGPVRAVPRLLRVLRDRSLPATFFVPGWVASRWPDRLAAIVDHGHEIAHHGWMHETYFDLTLDEQRTLIERAQEAFEQIARRRAVGYRSPSGDFAVGSHQMLRELGFSYSSAMRGDDRPYRWELDGTPSELIEIPAKWELDDFPMFGFHDAPPDPISRDRIGGLEWALDNWRREFDGYYREGLCFVMMMHPQVMGKPARVRLLERLLDHIQARGDVWFATGEQIADWWRQEY
jgi:peptidoglycan/xylan/chitin deacetylase (PgdA/CDA1 family)